MYRMIIARKEIYPEYVKSYDHLYADIERKYHQDFSPMYVDSNKENSALASKRRKMDTLDISLGEISK